MQSNISPACLPMLRPIFLKVFHRVFPNASISSSNKHNPLNGPKSFIKMSTMKTKSRVVDDSDSMHQLTSSDNDAISDAGDEDVIYGTGGTRVVITGNEGPSDIGHVGLPPDTMGRILVRSETLVQVTSADR